MQFTFKPQSWQKELASCPNFSEHVPRVISQVIQRLVTKQSSQGASWLDKSTITDEKRGTVVTDLWATTDCCEWLWFILSRVPPGLLATRIKEPEALQQRERNRFNQLMPPWVGSSYKKKNVGVPLYRKWTAYTVWDAFMLAALQIHLTYCSGHIHHKPIHTYCSDPLL